MNRLFVVQQTLDRRPVLRFGCAVLAVVGATLLRFAIADHLPPGYPFITYFPVVFAVAFLCGTAAGAVCALASGLAAWWFFIPPQGSLGVSEATAVAMGFYAFIAGLAVWLIHLLKQAALGLKTEQALTQKLLAGQTTMFQELQHRTANNMAFVAAMLRLGRRRLKREPGVADEVLASSLQRIEGLSVIHRRLYDPDAAKTPLSEHLELMIGELVKTSGREVDVEIDTADLSMETHRLIALVLFTSECVTNALKHAFHGRERGRIHIRIAPNVVGGMRLTVADDGAGLVEGPPKEGLGSAICTGLAGQLGGTMAVDNAPDGGVVVRLDFDPVGRAHELYVDP